MVIILDGSTKTARITIAEQAIENFPSWRHLALEVFEEAADPEEEKDFHLQVIKKCADELAKTDLHLILTMPGDSPQHGLLSTALKPDCTTVHLGTEDDPSASLRAGGEFDYTIDTQERSVNDVLKLMHTIMKAA